MLVYFSESNPVVPLGKVHKSISRDWDRVASSSIITGWTMRKHVHYLWTPTNQDDIICSWVVVEGVEGTKHCSHANRAAGNSKLTCCDTGISKKL